MRELKRMLFTLLISFLLWYLLQLLVASFLSGMSSIVALLFQMLTGLALSVYMSASEAAFYLETRLGSIPKRNKTEEPKEEPEQIT